MMDNWRFISLMYFVLKMKVDTVIYFVIKTGLNVFEISDGSSFLLLYGVPL
jgi:hypothetical protein